MKNYITYHVVSYHYMTNVMSCRVVAQHVSHRIILHRLISSLCTFCPTGDKVDKVSLSSSGDNDAPVNKPYPDTVTSVSSTSSPVWITARAATASNTLAESVYKTFTTSSLLRVLMHTTQPMFNGKMKHLRTLPRNILCSLKSTVFTFN